MANQLYAAPIIIEAFQTGKAAMLADYEIQPLNEAPWSPNNGLFIAFRRSLLVRLYKGIILIAAGISQKMQLSADNIPELQTFTHLSQSTDATRNCVYQLFWPAAWFFRAIFTKRRRLAQLSRAEGNFPPPSSAGR